MNFKVKWDDEYGVYSVVDPNLCSGISPDLALSDWNVPHTQVCEDRGKYHPGTHKL